MKKTENYSKSDMAAILGGPRTSFLDHLMPLCDLLNIPLICTDPWAYTAAKIFYPSTVSVQKATHENFQKTLSAYRTFVTVEPCRLHKEALQFGEFLYRGKVQTIAGFHGNSDKYQYTYWIERYLNEDLLLLYGQHNVDFFKEKGLWDRVKKSVFIGNLRLAYYKKHQSFFNEIVQPFFRTRFTTTILYAPSWSFSGSEDEGTFFESYPYILNNIPKDMCVIVKLHPYLFRLFPEKIEAIKEQYADWEQILFLDEIPLVYPFLFQADIYLGDYSSVGYDFLALDRPLFFLGETKGKIHMCGHRIADLKNFYSFLNQKDLFSAMRKELYAYSFTEIDREQMKKEIQGNLK